MRALSNNVSCVATGVVLAMLSGLADAGATTEGTLKFSGKLEAPPDRGCEIKVLTDGKINFVEEISLVSTKFSQNKDRRATFRIYTGGARRRIIISDAKLISAPSAVTDTTAAWTVRAKNIPRSSYIHNFEKTGSPVTFTVQKEHEKIKGHVELFIQKTEEFVPGEYEVELTLTCE